MSYLLDARLTVSVSGGSLRGPVVDHLRLIPGTAVWWRAGRVVCPPDALKVVRRILAKYGRDVVGIKSTIDPIKPGLLDKDILRERLDASNEFRPLIDGVCPIWDFTKPFQRWALAFLLHPSREGGFLESPVGSGKTLMATTWMCADGKPVSERRPILVVTKADVRLQYAEEIRRFTVLEPYVLAPAPKTKKALLAWISVEEYLDNERRVNRRPVVVAPWESLPQYMEQIGLLTEKSFDVVFDESTLGKAPKRGKWALEVDDADVWDPETGLLIDDSKVDLKFTPADSRAWHASRIARKATRRLAMTGTPIYDRLSDLWGQYDLVAPDNLGQTITRFKKRYMGAIPGEYGGLVSPSGKAGMSHNGELLERLAYMTVQIPYAIVEREMPPKRRMVTMIPVEQQAMKGWGLGSVGKEVRKAVKNLPKRADADTMDEHAQSILDRVTELRLEEAAMRAMPFVVRRVVELLERGDGKKKLILMGGRHSLCEDLGRHLAEKTGKLAVPPMIWTSHGETHDVHEREEIRKLFQEHPGPCVLNVTWQAWGMGKNLQDCDYIGVYQLPYEPGTYEQIEGRGQRLGRDRHLLIEYFVPLRTVAERVRILVMDKFPAVNAMAGDVTTIATALDDFRRTSSRPERMKSLKSAISQWFVDQDGEIGLGGHLDDD